MFTVDECKKIGYDACIDRLGREQVVLNKERGCHGFSIIDGGIRCFVGYDEKEYKPQKEGITLGTTQFDFLACAFVNSETGNVTFIN